MKQYDVCGLGNALVDIFLELSDDEFNSLGIERGTTRLVEADEQRQLLARFAGHAPRLVSGGSVANSIIALSQLGGKGAFIGCVGDDRYGLHYFEEFEQLSIEMGAGILVGETTGTCVSIVTPDAERTMRTALAVSSQLSAEYVDAQRITDSQWLFVEGFVFANPEKGQTAIREAVRIAKSAGTKVAVTCSEAFVVQVFGDAFFQTLAQADLLFCNASEACAVTGANSVSEAFQKLRSMVPNAVVTNGPHGAYVRYDGIEGHVPAFPCHPKDATGAGDMLAGTFLYGITHDYDPRATLRAANYLAMKVITQIGARLHHGTRSFFDEMIAG